MVGRCMPTHQWALNHRKNLSLALTVGEGEKKENPFIRIEIPLYSFHATSVYAGYGVLKGQFGRERNVRTNPKKRKGYCMARMFRAHQQHDISKDNTCKWGHFYAV